MLHGKQWTNVNGQFSLARPSKADDKNDTLADASQEVIIMNRKYLANLRQIDSSTAESECSMIGKVWFVRGKSRGTASSRTPEMPSPALHITFEDLL